MSIDGLRSGLRATGFERLEVSNTILMGVIRVWKRRKARMVYDVRFPPTLFLIPRIRTHL